MPLVPRLRHALGRPRLYGKESSPVQIEGFTQNGLIQLDLREEKPLGTLVPPLGT